MANCKSTKRALLTSALAILACVAMLIGTTFAWFTDTASTAVNKIVSGKLDVALEMWNGEKWENAEGKTLNFLQMQDGKLVQNADILWEPGATYQLPQLRVVNDGNLALKYTVKVTGVKGSAKLLEAIDFTVATKTETDNAEVAPLSDWEGVLLPKGAEKRLDNEAVYESEPFTIAGTMKTTAGNDYQEQTIDGIAITVYATQYTYESDSKDNTYDENAAYKGSQDFTSGTHILDKGGVALHPNDVAVLVSGEGTAVTITGGFYNGGEKGDNRCIQVDEGATVIIKDGTFTVGGDATGLGNSVVLCNGGTVIVEGGFFYTNYAYRNFYYVLNQQNNKPGTITVKGGTFVNYDPSKGDDNLGGNFVAEGYSVIAETKANGDVWYTVVKGTGVVAGTQEDLNKGITESTTKDVTVVLPKDNTLSLDNGIANESTKSRDITFKGDGSQTMNITTTDVGENGHNLNYQRGSSFVFENMTIIAGSDSYQGIVCNEVVFKNCTIKGFMTTYSNLTCENCVFESDTKGQYLIDFYGGENFKLNNCQFKGVDRNVYVYTESLKNDINVEFNDCTFSISATGDVKSAVMLNAPQTYNGYSYKVSFNRCSQAGGNTTSAENVAGKTNYQGIYGLKHKDPYGNGLLVNGTVTVDGTVVYQN